MRKKNTQKNYKKINKAVDYLKREALHAPKFLNEPIDYAEPVPFSRGMKIEIGGYILLFISGTASVDRHGETVHAGNFLAQTKRTFRNVTALINSKGATWKDVIKITCYLKDMRDYKAFSKFRKQFYEAQGLKIFPASTCTEANLCRRDLLVEIELIAIIKNTNESKTF